MKKIAYYGLFISMLIAYGAIQLSCRPKVREGNPRVLVFSKTAGFYHEAIPAGNEALLKMGEAHGFDVDTTTNANYFTPDSLGRYAAVVFLNTSGDVLDHYQEADFERYIQSGGGFVGIHAASDTEHHWGWYGRLVGGYFQDHPAIQKATVRVLDGKHPATQGLPPAFEYVDEWYNFRDLSPDIHVLLALDESTYEGGTHGGLHPISWYQDFDGGRSFYTGLGHTIESYTDSLFLEHLLGGIQYAIGGNRELGYRKAKTQEVPEPQRLVKTQLLQGELFEPVEMAILPNLDILIAQRRGELLLFESETQTVKQVGFLDVYHQSDAEGVSAEEGLLGIALDPDFKKNNFVFVFYSPKDTSVNRLSRFVFKDGKFDMESEVAVLEFYSQRDICCHTGGSIAFDKNGLLYLSTGDNATPFNQNTTYINDGYAPIDGRAGYEQYDARRSSGNTADLRGKILRIRVLKDGTYEIPEGNLFPPGTPNTRPEIYIMGCRNPYRISVDPKTGFLYWGDVGPDASQDDVAKRGPRGYDEINQAREAGFFGWPFFVGNNFAYRAYDYDTGESGELFDVNGAVNDSPNNTGLTVLPPAQPAFIWYPYAASTAFPQVGTGGRTAMAGPVYYSELYPKATRYPSYFDGKLFIYEWIRDWVKVVTMLPNGDFDKMEPFMADEKFAAPVDMEIGPDGRIYVLEYGKGWFSKNADAGIARLDYIPGNLPPEIHGLDVKKKAGALPFIVEAYVDAADFEGGELAYVWSVGGTEVRTDKPRLAHQVNEPGDLTLSVTVVDDHGNFTQSDGISLYAGNEPPVIEIELDYPTGRPLRQGDRVSYEVKVEDQGREIVQDNLTVTVSYVDASEATKTVGHQQPNDIVWGRSLMKASNCESCHKVQGSSVGPSFEAIAMRYSGKGKSIDGLAARIQSGGSGVWGTVAMPAHPDLTETEAKRIVKWIASLHGEGRSGLGKLPGKGEVVVKRPSKLNGKSVLQISAQYTSDAPVGIRPFTGTATVSLDLE